MSAESSAWAAADALQVTLTCTAPRNVLTDRNAFLKWVSG